MFGYVRARVEMWLGLCVCEGGCGCECKGVGVGARGWAWLCSLTWSRPVAYLGRSPLFILMISDMFKVSINRTLFPLRLLQVRVPRVTSLLSLPFLSHVCVLFSGPDGQLARWCSWSYTRGSLSAPPHAHRLDGI